MYDKVRLWLPRRPGAPDVAPLLDAATESVSHATGEVRVSGKLGNMRVEVKPAGIVVEGSLAKYLNGDNIRPFGRREAAEALEKLSDSACADFGAAYVRYVEFGRTYEMPRPTAEYLRRLGRLPRMERVAASMGTLYYRAESGKNKTRRELAFYDKGAEAGAAGNLLRYEMRFSGKLSQQLHAPGLTASMLTDPAFYGYMAARYKKYYEMIEKKGRAEINTDAIRTPGDAYDAITGVLLSRTDPAEVEALLHDIEARCGFDRLKMSRLKRMLREAREAGGPPSVSVIEELGEQVQAVGAD